MSKPVFSMFDQPQGPQLSGNYLIKKPFLTTLKGSDAKVKMRQWAIPDYLAMGEVTVLAGPKASGKSTLYVAMAAAVTRGDSHTSWPVPFKQKPTGVMIISTEDDWEKDIAPRLIASGADMSKIESITAKGGYTNNEDPYRFEREFDDHIYNTAQSMGGVGLVIVDPWTYLIQGSADNLIMVQRKMERMKKFASQFNAAVLLISHVIKSPKGRDPVARVSGSAAVVRVCRGLLLVAEIENARSGGNGSHVLVRAVTNIAANGNGWSYHIEGTDVPCEGGSVSVSKIVWDSELKGSPREILEKAESTGSKKRLSAVDVAGDFLTEALEEGARPLPELISEAKALGISESALIRAKKKLGIFHKKQEGAGQASPFLWYFEPANSTNEPKE